MNCHEPRTTDHERGPLLQFHDISKSFFGVRVLKNITFALQEGHVLGLVGENGAGKSTLMNLLGGNLQPDDGRMLLEGQPYAPRSPRDAEAHGIAFVHQELNLFTNLTIAENLFLTDFPTAGGLIRRAAIQSLTAELLAQVGLDLPADTLVERLSAGERQLVEIAKALSIDARVILFDEPTTSLTARETEHLFNLIGKLRERGLSMIYISHALNDVLRLCDDIVVLRDGEVVGQGARADFTADRMISLMVGREITQLFPERHRGETRTRRTIEASSAQSLGGHREESPQAPLCSPNLGASTPRPPSSAVSESGSNEPDPSEILLEINGISQPGVVKDISFTLHRGEVLGVSGLMGSGRTELARILFGLDPHERGEILIEGDRIDSLPPRKRVGRGLAFLTESRRDDGLCMEAAIADNIALVSAPSHRRGPVGWLNLGAMSGAVRRIRDAVKLTSTACDTQPVKTLSGGNQQKVVLAKWLLNEPRVLILDEPTRGIDVGAKHEVYTLINELAGRGAGVLVISSEIEELIGICDRILVMSRGEIRDEIQCDDFDRERILRSALKVGQWESTAEKGGRGG